MKNNAVRWIVSKSKQLITPIVLLAVISGVIAGLSVKFSLLSKDIIDIATGESQENIYYTCALLAAMIILQMIMQAVGSRLNIMVSGKLEMKLKGSLFSTLLKKDLSGVYKYHTGELLNRLTSDITVITNAFVTIIPLLISFLTRIIAAMWVLFVLDKSFAFIYVIAGPLFLFIARIYSNRMKAYHKKTQETEGRTRAYMTEAFQNLLVIKAFKKEKSFAHEANALQNDNYRVKIRKNTISILANIFVYIAFTFGYYFALGWGAFRIRAGLLTYGSLTAMLQLVGQIQNPIKGIADVLPTYYSMIASAERLMELEAIKDDTDSDILPNCANMYENCEKIVFSNVSFSYDRNNKILSGFDYEIKKGEFIAINGLSGIGKSTLLKLLLGVIEQDSGKIYLENSDGTKTRIDKYTRGLFAYVPQGNMVISGTIRDNIKFYNENAGDEQINHAVEIAQMSGYISELPDGIDTVIGEKGLGLSEGQVQRIAIARAILSDSPVLLLDEATSALDEKTEADFLKAIKALETKTCIIVSHKQAALEICDKIIKL